MRLKVFPHYILAFSVRGRRKVGTLYSPTKGSYSDYHEVQPVWMAEFGEGCNILKEGVETGSKGYVIDAYEMEDLPINLWHHYRKTLPDAKVKEIESEASTYDGFITANILHEDSIFAFEGEERV